MWYNRLTQCDNNKGCAMMGFLDETGRWLLGAVFIPVFLWFSSMVSKLKKDKVELKAQVDKLERKINSVEEKMDSEILERKTREEKFDKFSEKVDSRFDKISELLVEVKVNTAVNASKIEDK
jgi:uncharacterized protein YlxW (UPF0749 family)